MVPRISVRWLANGYVRVKSVTPAGRTRLRNEPPSGSLSVDEAAAALKTNGMRIYRMLADGRLRPVRSRGARRLAIADLRPFRGDLGDARRERGAA